MRFSPPGPDFFSCQILYPCVFQSQSLHSEESSYGCLLLSKYKLRIEAHPIHWVNSQAEVVPRREFLICIDSRVIFCTFQTPCDLKWLNHFHFTSSRFSRTMGTETWKEGLFIWMRVRIPGVNIHLNVCWQHRVGVWWHTFMCVYETWKRLGHLRHHLVTGMWTRFMNFLRTGYILTFGPVPRVRV